jgi:aryl-alcohol dehydrogenase-like predicted oxidoreductase
MKALGISDKRGWARFETLQAYYSLAGRDMDSELVPLMADQTIGCMVWSPLAGGYLSGKFSPGGEGDTGGRRAVFDFPPIDKAQADAVVAVMRPIAKAHGVSVARVALTWVLAKPWVTTVIIGAKTIAQLDDNLEAITLKLTAEELAALDEASAPAVQYPHWMVSRLNALRLQP